MSTEKIEPPDNLTPTQKRIFNVLSDGKFHYFHELFACLDDELSARGTVSQHLSHMRERLRGTKFDVTSERRGRKNGSVSSVWVYRLVILISPPLKC